MLIDLKKNNHCNTITARVKSQNSIEYKVENYIKNHNNGEVPLTKCFNDIYWIRIILENEIKYNDVKEFIGKKFTELKCIDYSKKEYVATHIYLKKK